MIKLIFNIFGLGALSFGCMYFLWESSYHLLFMEREPSEVLSFRYLLLATVIGIHSYLAVFLLTMYTHIIRWYETKTFEKPLKFTALHKKAMLIFGIIGIIPYFINTYYIEKYDLIRCESDLILDRDDFYFSRYVSSIEKCPIKLEANKKK
ncbi:hypothetical protein [Aliivibrio logei]|uniref:hypothetical protein n=1 Tax=Aliivibrio logei TaxID=688 RepID=UPI0035C886A5